MKIRILLTIIAAALVFTGCAKKPEFDNQALKNSYQKELEEYKRQQAGKKPTPSLDGSFRQGFSFS